LGLKIIFKSFYYGKEEVWKHLVNFAWDLERWKGSRRRSKRSLWSFAGIFVRMHALDSQERTFDVWQGTVRVVYKRDRDNVCCSDCNY
jgi:hypothetical protein